LTSIALALGAPSPPIQLLTSVRVNVYYTPSDQHCFSPNVCAPRHEKRITVRVTPVLGVETSKSVLMSKAGLLVQHCLLVAVLHVCLGTSWCTSGGAAKAPVALRSKPQTTLHGDSKMLGVGNMVKNWKA
jgi:hypothetical protein